jgi:hypothetical protein
MSNFDRNPIKNRDDFKHYCLRQLGDGVITINVSDEQLEDCINDSIKWAQEFLDEGNFLSVVAHKITQEDLDAGYFQLNESILGVKDVLYENGSSNQMFTVSYMTKVGLIDALAHPFNGLSNYYFMKFNLSQLDMLINPVKPFRYDYNTNRLYVDINWSGTYIADTYLLFVAYIAIDPEESPNLWNNNFLKKYCTARIQKQWGLNLSKYSGISLPGNTQVNGEKILSEANEELERLQKEVEQYASNPSPMWASILG